MKIECSKQFPHYRQSSFSNLPLSLSLMHFIWNWHSLLFLVATFTSFQATQKKNKLKSLTVDVAFIIDAGFQFLVISSMQKKTERNKNKTSTAKHNHYAPLQVSEINNFNFDDDEKERKYGTHCHEALQ